MQLKLTTIKLLTVIAEVKLKQELIVMLREEGVSGYTFFNAEGQGFRDLRVDSQSEAMDAFQLKVLVPENLCKLLMKKIAIRYFSKEHVTVFAQDADVIRAEKFSQISYKTIHSSDPT